MSELITFYDAVTVENIPAAATHVAYYVDGTFANGDAMRQRFPKATMLSITVEGSVADACDCETGDMTVATAAAWAHARVAAGQYRPIVYANLNTWADLGLMNALAPLGDKVRRWLAEWNNVADIPAGYDAHQYATGSVDTNVAYPEFFATAPAHPKPKPTRNTGIAKAELQYDFATGKWEIHGIPGEHVEFGGKHQLVHFHGSLEAGVNGGPWHIHRGRI
jgi:hypothetical protein